MCACKMDSLLWEPALPGEGGKQAICSSCLVELHVTAHIGKAARAKAQHPNHCLPRQIFFSKLFLTHSKMHANAKENKQFTAAPSRSMYKLSTYFQVREISME